MNHGKNNEKQIFPGFAVAIIALLLGSTAASQIPISTIEELQKIGYDESYPLDGHYILVQDIDASATRDWNDGRGFNPIGEGQTSFTGIFDGQGHLIKGLCVNRPERGSAGIFDDIDGGAEIRNTGVEGGFFRGFCVGSLVMSQSSGKIINCHSTATVSGTGWIGGLIGVSHSGTVLYCHAAGEVSGEKYSKSVGGLIGHCAAQVVFRCYASAAVSGDEEVGGLLGLNHSTLAECYATGPVRGRMGVGGLVGHNGGIIANCYATGSVSGKLCVGGLAGFDTMAMNACYACGDVKAKDDAGGLTGSLTEQTMLYWGWNVPSFWDVDTSGQQHSDKGNGIPTDRMMLRSTFEDAGWDFETVWGIHESTSRPYLLWETGEAPSRPTRNYHELINTEIGEDRTVIVQLDPAEEEPARGGAPGIPQGRTPPKEEATSQDTLQAPYENPEAPASTQGQEGPRVSEDPNDSTVSVTLTAASQEQSRKPEAPSALQDEEYQPAGTEADEHVGCCYGCRKKLGEEHVLGDWLLIGAALTFLIVYSNANKRS